MAHGERDQPGPTASVTAIASGSLVFGAGNDYDNASAHALGSGQTLVHHGSTRRSAIRTDRKRKPFRPLRLAVATINDSAPTADRWNLAAVEIVPR